MVASQDAKLLLPSRVDPRLLGFGVAGSCRSAMQVSGDFFDVLPLSNNLVLLVIADVMGKGLPAGLFAGSLRTLLRATANPWSRPSELLAEVNQLMFDDLSSADLFITVQLVLADLHQRHLIVGNAGHCPLLLCDGQGLSRTIAPEGMPLGVQPDATFCDQTASFPAFGSMLLYTDGLTEARDSGGRFFGQDGLENWMRHNIKDKPTALQLRGSLLNELSIFQGGLSAPDDQTFLILADETPRPVVPLPSGAYSIAAHVAGTVLALAE